MMVYLPIVGAMTMPFMKNPKFYGFCVMLVTLVWYTFDGIKWTFEGWFMLLTLMIMPGALLSSHVNVQRNEDEYVMLMLALESIMLKFFSTNNLFMFYIAFEMSLIPLYFMVNMKLNYSITKKTLNRATNLLFMYTLVGSLLMLLGLLWMMTLNNNLEYFDKTNMKLGIWVLLFVGLAFKMPLLPVHIWLFRAHAEAPVSVSIVLSSVVLKMATYGYVKLLIIMLDLESTYMMPIVEMVLIMSLIYTSLSALRQYDMKALVAISSISHQAIVMIGLFSSVTLANTDNNKGSWIGPLMLSIGHGFVSPGLFMCTGSILYDRYHSRTMYYYRGLSKWMPMFTTLMFMLTLMNLGMPLTMNFYGEMLSIWSMVKSNLIVGFFTAMTIILSALYSMLLFGRLNFGMYQNFLYFCFDVNRRETYILNSWIMFVFIVGILPNIMLQIVYM